MQGDADNLSTRPKSQLSKSFSAPDVECLTSGGQPQQTAPDEQICICEPKPNHEISSRSPSFHKFSNFFSLGSLGRRKNPGMRRADSLNPEVTTRRPTLKRSLTTKTENLKRSITAGTATFFGVPEDVDYCVQKWTNRRMRHCSRRYGAVREPSPHCDFGTIDSTSTRHGAALASSEGSRISGRAFDVARSISIDGSRASDDPLKRKAQSVFRRDSVAKMAWEGLSSIVRSPTKRQESLRRKVAELQPDGSSSALAPSTAIGSVNDESNRSAQPRDSNDVNVECENRRFFGTAFFPSKIATEPSKIYAALLAGRSVGDPVSVVVTGTLRTAGLFSRTLREPASNVSEVVRGVSDRERPNNDNAEQMSTIAETFNESTESAVQSDLTATIFHPSTRSRNGNPRERRLSLETASSKVYPPNFILKVVRRNSVDAGTGPTNPLLDEAFVDLSPLTLSAPPTYPPARKKLAARIRASPESYLDVIKVGHASGTSTNQQHRCVRWSLFEREEHQTTENGADSGAGIIRRRSSDLRAPKSEFYRNLTSVEEELPEDSVDGGASGAPSKFDSSGVVILESGEKLLPPPSVQVAQQCQDNEEGSATLGSIVVDWSTMSRRRQSNYAETPPSKSSLMGRALDKVLFRTLSDSSRRRFGEGVLGKFFGRMLRKPHEMGQKVQEQLDDYDDYRPYFTYWVMTVHILVLLISLASYGFGPFGFARRQYSAMVLQTSLVLEQVAFFEKENFWLGPRFADLVHLGAKYAPCMRLDKNVQDEMDKKKFLEKNSACCIRNDGTGCVQTTRDNCPSLLATWFKWNSTNNLENRTSGSVCSQDSRECRKPASIEPFKWPDDITQWPICTETAPVRNFPHTKCEVTGKPCCIGILGECRITTPEYCDFVRGYFHEEATLCSQVSCLSDVCGMIPFVDQKRPDQFYRLFTSMFLHAGLLHCFVTLLVQYYLMRDLEKLIGWLRLSVIYLCSGLAGNLASAVFVPYEPEVGPAGCHFGLLAALLTDAIYSWPMIVRPYMALAQLFSILGLLFTLGLLPWVDNWAHAFGFLFGLLFSLALFPYIQFKKNDFRRRLVIITVSMSIAVALFTMLLSLFYFKPLWQCTSCVYFNCIPLTEHFCDNEGLTLQPLPF